MTETLHEPLPDPPPPPPPPPPAGHRLERDPDDRVVGGVCAALGWGQSWQGWKRVLAAVDSYADLEVPLLQSVERLIDFVTEDAG